jgi:hypothetical protein
MWNTDIKQSMKEEEESDDYDDNDGGERME